MYITVANLTPAPIPASATGVSIPINMNGNTRLSVGLQSDHAGTLSVQRYVDPGSSTVTPVIPLGVAATVACVAATPNSVGFYDGLPCGSVIISFINSAGAVANITKLTALVSP